MNNKSTLVAMVATVLIIIVGFVFMGGGFKSKSDRKVETPTAPNLPVFTDSEKAEADRKAQEVVVAPLLETEGSGTITEEAVSECDKYEKDEDKKSCYESQERDSMYSFASIKECAGLKYSQTSCEDYFYYKSAENEKDPRYCSMIKDAKVAAACADKVWYVAAVAKSDPKYCEPIRSQSLKSQCLASVKAASEQSAKIVAEETAFNKATNQWDTAACAALVDPLKVASCIESAVNANLDIALCSKLLPKKEDAEICYKKLSYDYDRLVIQRAYQEKNAALCDKAYEPTIRTQCKQMKFQ